MLKDFGKSLGEVVAQSKAGKKARVTVPAK
jgi:hypothetical protein